ncbi:hypothetical protein Tco_0431928 [Tanacetum coccineum]
MSSSSTVTYMSMYTDSEPWRFYWGSDDEIEAPEEAPQYPRQASLSSNYVPEPEYPEYLFPSDANAPIEDQPLLDDASPAALSPGYIADFDPEEDPKEDLEEDPTDYPADGEDYDNEDESSDDDDDDEVQEAFEDDDEEEEHPASIDSSVVHVDDHVPLTEDTEEFETDESAPTHVPSPRRHMARMFVRPQTPMLAATEALIAAVAAALPSSPPPSPLTPLSSPLP